MLKYDKHIQIHTGTTGAKPCPKIIGNSGIESEDRQEVALRGVKDLYLRVGNVI